MGPTEREGDRGAEDRGYRDVASERAQANDHRDGSPLERGHRQIPQRARSLRGRLNVVKHRKSVANDASPRQPKGVSPQNHLEPFLWRYQQRGVADTEIERSDNNPQAVPLLLEPKAISTKPLRGAADINKII